MVANESVISRLIGLVYEVENGVAPEVLDKGEWECDKEFLDAFGVDGVVISNTFIRDPDVEYRPASTAISQMCSLPVRKLNEPQGGIARLYIGDREVGTLYLNAASTYA